MTDFQNINFEKKNQIAYITLNRPKVLNALNMAIMEELRQAFAAVKDDAEVRVVILTGAGEKAFVAGADIGELSQHNPVSAKEYTHKGQADHDCHREPGQADHRLHQRIRSGRRLRAGDGLHHAPGKRECQARPARGEAWPDPRLRRNAAPVATGGQGNRDAIGADGRDDHGAGGASHRAGERSSSRRRTDRRAPRPSPRRSSPMRRWRFSTPWRR